MPLTFVRNDITKMAVDAIVNAANQSLLGGGGVDGAIHRAAGPELLEECRTLNGCGTGEAKITKGYRLPAKYVIHTVGPVYKDGLHGEPQLLRSCYRESMRLAAKNGCTSIAFPLISAGVYGYPREEAVRIAAETIAEELEENEMEAYLVFFDKGSLAAGKELHADIQAFIDDNYAADALEEDRRRGRNSLHFSEATLPPFCEEDICSAATRPAVYKEDMYSSAAEMPGLPKPKGKAAKAGNMGKSPLFAGAMAAPAKPLSDFAKELDESFQQMLMRKIAESGEKPSDIYHRANISKAHFSKINCDEHYKPTKKTVCAFAIALKLSPDETKELLMKAGFALSHSSLFDVIIEYFIRNGNYDIFAVNEALFDYDQELLGV